MALLDDVVRLLATPPREDLPPATEAARSEAAATAKRGDAAYTRDPRGDGPAQALPAYVEALELDPSCKPAYEGIAKVVLAKANEPPALEAALPWLVVATRRNPADASLREYERKIRSLLPKVNRELALAQKASESGARRPLARATGRPNRTCEYCHSPIPAGAESCRSCQLSGELEAPAGLTPPGSSSPVAIVAVVVAIFLVVVGVGAAYLLSHRPAPAPVSGPVGGGR